MGKGSETFGRRLIYETFLASIGECLSKRVLTGERVWCKGGGLTLVFGLNRMFAMCTVLTASFCCDRCAERLYLVSLRGLAYQPDDPFHPQTLVR